MFMALTVAVVMMGATEADTIVLHETFDDPQAMTRWSGSAGELVTGHESPHALRIHNPDPAASASRTIEIPGNRISGQLITVTAKVRAEDVSAPPNSWNGVKVMAVLEVGEGKQYPQLSFPAGSFDWREVSRTMRVPSGVTAAALVLGMEKVSGTVWFDDIVIRLGRPVTGGQRSDAPFKGHDLPRLRGVMHGPKFNEENIRHLAEEWGANQIRWQLNWSPMKEAETLAQDLDAYDKWLDGALAECDKALDACEKYGIHVLVDLHTPPGGRADHGVCRMFSGQRYQDKFIQVWDRIARRYKGREVVYAYDLLNEAVEGSAAPGLLTWRELATKAAKTIRAVAPGKPVVFEPSPWGGPGGFDTIIPLDIDRVIYSFHMYLPHSFTHQGVYNTPVGIAYPGTINGLHWDKERLREAMLPAIEFQREYNVHIYVGEFSAIRWAPGNSAYRYLRDVIDLFEEYGWDWSYHAYREWDGWSVEHGPDKNDRTPSPTPTDRQKLLVGWFAKNGMRLP